MAHTPTSTNFVKEGEGEKKFEVRVTGIGP